MTQEEQWLLEEKYGGEKTAGFFADCERLHACEPLGYVIGWVPFLDTRIHLDSRPLIPRSETEYWVEKAIYLIKSQCQGDTLTLGTEYWADTATATIRKDTNIPVNWNIGRDLHVLDLCAGSGCVGVAIAKAIPNARVDFGEIDSHHLPTIKKNLEENVPDYSNRLEYYRVLWSDLFAELAEQYDYILCNPPYIDPALDRTETSVKVHEPREALYGGANGMELIAHIITEAPEYLKQNGQLWLEHEPEQSMEIQRLANEHGFATATHTDQFGLERFSILVLQLN